MELRARVVLRPGSLGDGDRAEVVVGGAEAVHVALGDERVEAVHAEGSVGRLESAGERVGTRGARALCVGLLRARRLQRRVREYAGDVVGESGLDREHRLHHHGAGGRAA